MVFRFSKFILLYARRNGIPSAFNLILCLIVPGNLKSVEQREKSWSCLLKLIVVLFSSDDNCVPFSVQSLPN